MNYLVNFKIIEGEFYYEQFLPKVELINIDNKIWANMPIGLISPTTDQKELYLSPEGLLLDSQLARTFIADLKAKTKLFKLSIDENGKVFEDDKGEVIVRLPLEVDLNELEYINGEILWFSEEEGDN